ncbi:MAG: biopolymer transporter ExbD [Kiritimatiellaeota bacterium]|nr:biopolymer transporter ExbD [Kiritimatiellota bacterium]
MTPLMDLTFLLLIVFMIAAPLLEYAVDVSPPRMDARQPEDEKNLVVSMNAEGRLFVGKEPVTLGELRLRLAALCRDEPDLAVFIRADENRPYGEVIAIMRTVRKAGLENVSLVTQAEDD